MVCGRERKGRKEIRRKEKERKIKTESSTHIDNIYFSSISLELEVLFD